MSRYFTRLGRFFGSARFTTSYVSWHSLVRALTIMACLSGDSSTGASAATPASADAVAGTWTGVLGTKEAALDLTLTVTRSSEGEYSAEIDIAEQGVVPIDSLTLEGRAVRFEIKAVGGIYRGQLNDSGIEIDGTWKQASGSDQPLSFKRGTSSAEEMSATLPGPTTRPFSIPLDVRIPVAPTPFTADGKTHLVYELYVTNMSRWSCVLSGLDVVAGDSSSRPLASFTQANLQRMIQWRVGERSRLAPEASAVVYVWVTLDRPEDAPAKLQHRLQVKVGDYAEVLTLHTRTTTVTDKTLVISAPLRGDRWVAMNGPSNTSGHRRALTLIDGRATIAQRFAIDWTRLGDDGKTYHGDPLDNANYYADGAEALAVADGVVAEVLDGVPSNVPGVDSRAVPITLENVGGNYVVLDIGNGHHAFYAHLQPGSLRVKVGDKVRRGQVVGRVGNTGNSTEPHLHFHISDATSPLGAEGLPYALTSFERQGSLSDIRASKEKFEKRTLALPADGEIVGFKE